MPEAPLFEQELETFNAHLPHWQANGIGGFALIKGIIVRGTYETENDAINVGYETYGNVPFLVKPIVELAPIITINQHTLDQIYPKHRQLGLRRFGRSIIDFFYLASYYVKTPNSEKN